MLDESASGLASLYKQTRSTPTIPEPDVVTYDGQQFIRTYNEKGVPHFQQIKEPTGGGEKGQRIKDLLAAIKVEQANLQPDQTVVNAYRKELQQLMGIGNSLKEDGAGSDAGFKVVSIRPAGSTGPATQSPPHTEEGGPDEQTPNQLMDFSHAPSIPSAGGIP